MTEEYVSGVHVASAKNVPLVFPKFNPKGPSMPGWPPGCSGDPNPNFIAEVQDVCGPEEAILAIYATGGRGAMAVNALVQTGFTKVYNIVNGFEGDRVGACTTGSTCGTAGRTSASSGATISIRT